MKQRKSSDRRSNDRRMESLAIDLERRIIESRRSGFDRREILAAQA